MAKQYHSTLQEPYLNALRREKVSVAIYLVNGIKLQGVIESFDQFMILLKSSAQQLVYKHAISTIVPLKAFTFNAYQAMNGENKGDVAPPSSTEGTPEQQAET